ncbi:MAG TPA: DedA family protein [Candidatus Binataceae bacterium]|nr:DedA family protein [Candidatus Binataceae bacterium]
MTGLVSPYVEPSSYLGLLVVLVLCGLGLPMPEDVVLLAGGYLAHQGLTRYPITIAVCLVGVLSGDTSLFFLGRRFGSGILRYFGLGSPLLQSRIAYWQEFMRRHGHRAIFYGRFLAGLRALIYISAGTLGVPPSRFFFYDVMGALISVPIVVSVGYVFGKEIEVVLRYIGGAERVIGLIVVLSIIVYATRLFLPRNNSAARYEKSEAGAE